MKIYISFKGSKVDDTFFEILRLYFQRYAEYSILFLKDVAKPIKIRRYIFLKVRPL